MRRNLTLFGITALALALAAPLAFAKGPGFGPGPDGDGFRGRGERGARMTAALELSEEQSTAFKQMRDAQREQGKTLHEEIKTKRDALGELWKAGADRAQIVALTQEISALRTQLQLNRVDFMFDVKGLLTPEQFTKFVDMKGPHGRMGKRGKRGMRGHHGRMGKRGENGRMGKRGKRGMRGDCPNAPSAAAPEATE